MTPRESRGGNSKDRGIPIWEWLLAGLGTVIVLGAITFFIVQAVSPLGAPELRASVDSIFPSGQRYTVMLVVQNDGRTAGDVVVEATLTSAGAILERAETALPFVPAKSQHQAAVLFSRDPRQHQLQLTIRSYHAP